MNEPPRHTSPARSVRLIAFDADDTLWDNQSHFARAERAYCDILAPFGDAHKVSAALFSTESDNMPLLGYGCKAFTISLVETAVRVSEGRVPATDILRIVNLGKELLSLPATPLPHVADTLRGLRDTGRYQLAVFTKGELLDQRNKLERSGLGPLFDDIVVVADKTQAEYRRLCHFFEVDAGETLMVGNSFKSDVEPMLRLGGWAAHIPFHTTWRHEETEEYDHRRLFKLHDIKDVLTLMR